MTNAVPASILPDPARTLRREFRVEGALAVRAVLRELMSHGVLVTLYPEGRNDDALVTRIVHLDASSVEFDLTGQPTGAKALAGARHVIAVAFPGSIKTQFTVAGFSLVDEDGSPARPAAATTLQAPIPDELYRMQRRDAFRVEPPPEDDAHCVRLLAGSEVRYRLLDLSAGGLSIRLPVGIAPPHEGEIWPHCRIEAAPDRVIPCDLVVRGRFEEPAGSGEHRVRFEFQATPSEVLRKIQLYVLEIERRQIRRN